MEEQQASGGIDISRVQELKDEGNLLFKQQDYEQALAAYFTVCT